MAGSFCIFLIAHITFRQIFVMTKTSLNSRPPVFSSQVLVNYPKIYAEKHAHIFFSNPRSSERPLLL